MKFDSIVVGGGIAGLTAAAYIARAGKKVALFEKEDKVGGLVSSFEYKGFTLDGGIRAIEDLGIVFPMLKQLGIDVEFVKNEVSIGVEDIMVALEDEGSLSEYKSMLNMLFPENEADINKIIGEVKKIMGYMDIQYGIENPVFKDLKNDKEYLKETLLPWLFKYILTIGKIRKYYEPVDDYLRKLTKNQALIDMIAQHFFQKTPAYFALSYFTLYLDYMYPYKGTGTLPNALREYIEKNGGEIRVGTSVKKVDVQNKTVTSDKGKKYEYDCLVWAADSKTLYNNVELESITSQKTVKAVKKQIDFLNDKKGGDSVLTIYALSKLDVDYFKEKHGAHVFYTPYKKGLNNIGVDRLKNKKDNFTGDKNDIKEWLLDYFKYTTFEIAIPAIRNSELAPEGKSGLIISTLMDYDLVNHIEKLGFYEEFKQLAQEKVIQVLNETIYPRFKEHVEESFCSTPLSIKKLTGNSDGAITGWAFTNKKVPAVSKLTAIAKSVKTKLPGVYQAGQWTFSPSGLPISVITGKMAADKVLKDLSKMKSN